MKETHSYREPLSVNRGKNREKKTIKTMINMYCVKHHGTGEYICNECQQLLDYAEERLKKCPFKDEKLACANCRVHCYKPDMREEVLKVMHYSGLRMAYRHPVLALHHLIGRRHKPKGGIKR